VNFLHHVGAESIAVSELRLGIVDALVDRASQMLQKRAKENWADWRNLPAGIDNHARRTRRALSQTESAQCGTRSQGHAGLTRLLEEPPS
jgi:hypothetical protein